MENSNGLCDFGSNLQLQDADNFTNENGFVTCFEDNPHSVSQFADSSGSYTIT